MAFDAKYLPESLRLQLLKEAPERFSSLATSVRPCGLTLSFGRRMCRLAMDLSIKESHQRAWPQD